jgi:superfamily II DNA or RNA helicase
MLGSKQNDGTPRPILANRLYVPEQLVTDDLLERFRLRWIEQQYRLVVDENDRVVMLSNGKQKTERVEIVHVIEAYRELLTAKQTWIGLPRGDDAGIQHLLRRALDLRTINPLGFRLRLRHHVLDDARWPDQNKCVDAWLDAGTGIILGQTGAGKTIIGMGCVARLGLQTLILSKRGDGEKHWEAEFREHTNVERLEKQMGRRLVGPYRHKGAYPISVATVQTFLHPKGYGRLIDDQFRFGLVVADEIHELVSPEFVRVFSLWAPLSWLGLTATIERLDKREFLAYKIIGPVVARLGADQMKPEVHFIETNFSVPAWMEGRKPFSAQWKWGRLLQMMSTDQSRIDLIVRTVMDSIDDGRLVAVLAERLILAKEIFRRLKQNGYDVCYVDGAVPNKRRETLYHELAAGKYRCICAGLKVMDAMVSIKPLNCLHLVTPVNARHRIMQIFGRTRRPDKNKPMPLVYYYKDTGGQLSGAFNNVTKVCQAEGWTIHQRSRNLANLTMTKWKKK